MKYSCVMVMSTCGMSGEVVPLGTTVMEISAVPAFGDTITAESIATAKAQRIEEDLRSQGVTVAWALVPA